MTTRKAIEKSITLGHPQLDRHLEFVAARGRPNTLLATASDLKLFFESLDKEPADVTADSGRFRTPIPVESVHRFRGFRTPLREAGRVRV